MTVLSCSLRTTSVFMEKNHFIRKASPKLKCFTLNSDTQEVVRQKEAVQQTDILCVERLKGNVPALLK